MEAACPLELPMIGFLTACTEAVKETGVEVDIPEKSAKPPPLLLAAAGTGLLLMKPNAEPDEVEGAASGVGAGNGGDAAGGGLMNPKPDADAGADVVVDCAAKGSAGVGAVAAGGDEMNPKPDCDAAGAEGTGAGVELPKASKLA